MTSKGRKKRYTKYLTLNIKEEMDAGIRKIATKNDELISDVVRRAISKELERNSN